MMILKNLKDLQGSTVSVNYIGPKNAPYKLTGEFQRIAFSRIIIDGLKSGRTHRIPLEKVISIAELDSDPKIFTGWPRGSLKPQKGSDRE
jgi:hypothetical protein